MIMYDSKGGLSFVGVVVAIVVALVVFAIVG